MVLNLGIRELGLLDCCVEEMDERIGEVEQQDVIDIVNATLQEVEMDGET